MAFISISKCFNISPHLRWFMAFIRGYERWAFLWFRDIISDWHIQRLNRVLRSHFLWTPNAHPGPGNLSLHPSRYALQLVKMAQRYFCPQGDWQGGGDENIPATSRDILLDGSRTPLPLIPAPGNVLRVSLKERWAEEDAIIIVGNRLFRTPFHLVCWRSQKHLLPDVRL